MASPPRTREGIRETGGARHSCTSERGQAKIGSDINSERKSQSDMDELKSMFDQIEESARQTILSSKEASYEPHDSIN